MERVMVKGKEILFQRVVVNIHHFLQSYFPIGERAESLIWSNFNLFVLNFCLKFQLVCFNFLSNFNAFGKFFLSNFNLFAVKREERQGWNIYECAGRGGVGHWFYFAKNRLGLDTGLILPKQLVFGHWFNAYFAKTDDFSVAERGAPS